MSHYKTDRGKYLEDKVALIWNTTDLSITAIGERLSYDRSAIVRALKRIRARESNRVAKGDAQRNKHA